jgi:hypothetical protein
MLLQADVNRSLVSAPAWSHAQSTVCYVCLVQCRRMICLQQKRTLRNRNAAQQRQIWTPSSSYVLTDNANQLIAKRLLGQTSDTSITACPNNGPVLQEPVLPLEGSLCSSCKESWSTIQDIAALSCIPVICQNAYLGAKTNRGGAI